MFKKLVLAVATAGLLAVAAPLAAQDHSGHGDHAAAPADPASSPAVAAYKAAMDKMHADMMAQVYTGDADVDFVRGMIPHHQAAIDMAKIVLEHGKHAEIRKLAEAIISAQEAEIAEMNAWLGKNAK